MASLELAGRLLLLVAGLLVPGGAVLRALQLPLSVAGSFAGSAVVLYAAVLLLAPSGLPLSFRSLAAALALVTLAAAGVIRFRPRATAVEGPTASRGAPPPFPRLGRWTPLYLLFLGIVLFRATFMPLSGPDVEFRWSWLAEQILRLGSLDFYPPHRAADFAAYFWAESIPPGIASLYAWAYACGGSFAAGWTTPVVLLQFWALHELLWHTAGGLAGPRAAAMACLAAAACPLLNWSLFIGQETGLTAVALLGMTWALLPRRDSMEVSWAVLAGVFAALGSSAREYGPIFPAFGAAILLLRRVPRRTLAAYLLSAAPLCLLWLARCTLRTGNPVYSLDLGPLFPTNELFALWRGHDRSLHGNTLTSRDGWFALLRLFALFAPTALIGWILMAVTRPPGRALLIGATSLSLGLWLLSVPHTFGGPFYSQRVASPAVALGALVAGIALSRLPPRLGSILLACLVLATLPQTLTLPLNAWRIPVSEWPGLRSAGEGAVAARQQSAAIASAAGAPARLVADNAGHQARLAPFGISVLPPWSPEAAWLFNPNLESAEATRLWHATGIRHLLLARFEPTLAFVHTRARWNHPPFAARIIWADDHSVLLELGLRGP